MFRSIPNRKHSIMLLENLYYFSELQMLDCNMYILKDENEKLCLIDLGNGLSMKPLINTLEQHDLNPKNISKILITHEHLDHIMGIYPLMELLKDNPPEIFAHPYTADLLEEGDENKVVPRMFGVDAKNFGLNVVPIKSITRINENDELKIGIFDLKVIYTPGHSKGSISFYEMNNKILFPGDVVFPQGSFGRYDFPGCSLNDLKKSINRLAELDTIMLCSGHMPPVEEDAKLQIARSKKNINWM